MFRKSSTSKQDGRQFAVESAQGKYMKDLLTVIPSQHSSFNITKQYMIRLETSSKRSNTWSCYKH